MNFGMCFPLGTAALQLGALANAAGAAHIAVHQRIASALALEPSNYANTLGLDSFTTESGLSGTIAGYTSDNKGVAWASDVVVEGDGEYHSSLAIWNGPRVEVPHLFLQLDVSERGGVELEVDFRPRLNAGYELVRADGSFAEPTSRAAFAMSELRVLYDERYFTDEARAWCAGVAATPGASSRPSMSAHAAIQGRRQFGGETAEDGGGQVAGPLLVSTRLPLDESSLEACAAAYANAANRWLGWMASAEDASWVKNRMIFDRDCQVRQLLHAASGRAMRQRFGEQGPALAAAAAGRLDMAGHNFLQVRA